MKCRKCDQCGHFTKDCHRAAAGAQPPPPIAPITAPPTTQTLLPPPAAHTIDPSAPPAQVPVPPPVGLGLKCRRCGAGHFTRDCPQKGATGPVEEKKEAEPTSPNKEEPPKEPPLKKEAIVVKKQCKVCGDTSHFAKDCPGTKKEVGPRPPKKEPVKETKVDVKEQEGKVGEEMKENDKEEAQKNTPAEHPPKENTKPVVVEKLCKICGDTTHFAKDCPGPKINSALDDEVEVILKKVNGILNKVSAENYEACMQSMLKLHVDVSNQTLLSRIIDCVFEHAVQHQLFCSLYADMCLDLTQTLAQTHPKKKDKEAKSTVYASFRRALLDKCQVEFEEAPQVPEWLSPEKREEYEKKVRVRQLGNIKFIGELFKRKMLSEKIIHEMIKHLLLGSPPQEFHEPSDEEVEMLCFLLAMVGQQLDHPEMADHMDRYFVRITALQQRHPRPRIRFMLQNTIDLRNGNWVPRREERKAPTPAELETQIPKQLKKQEPLLAKSPLAMKEKGKDGQEEAGKDVPGGSIAASSASSSSSSSLLAKQEFIPPTAEELAAMAEISRRAQEEVQRLQQEREAATVRPSTPEQCVAQFYAERRPMRRDLFRELASASSFIIEGDSLLLEVLDNSLLDFKYGGQTLAVVFQVERLLHNLVSRGARFEVAFFQCHAAIWGDNPLGALLREILIHHLRGPCNLTVHIFDNYWGAEWNAHLARQKPGFMMLSDAEQVPVVCKDVKVDVPFMYHTFLIRCVAIWHLTCVFTSRIVFRGSRGDVWVVPSHPKFASLVDAFYSVPKGAHEKIKNQIEPLASSFIEMYTQEGWQRDSRGCCRCHWVPDTHPTQTMAELQGLCTRHWALFAGWARTLVVTVGAAREMVREAPESAPFLKAVLLHHIVRAAVPLEWRAQPLPFSPPPAYGVWVAQWLAMLLRFVSAYNSQFVADRPVNGDGLVDIFDGRLVVYLMRHLGCTTEALGLPTDALKYVEELWAIVSAEPLFPISKGCLGFVDLAPEASTDPRESLPANPLATLAGIDCQTLARPRLPPVPWKEDWFFANWDLEGEKGRVLDVLDDVQASDRRCHTQWERNFEAQRHIQISRLQMEHAASLTGAPYLKPGEILAAVSKDDKDGAKKEKADKRKDQEKQSEEKEKRKHDKEDKKKKPEKESLKDKIKRENEAALAAKLLEKETRRWVQFQAHLDKDRRRAVRQIEVDFLKKCEQPHVALEARFYIIHLRMEIWREYCGEVIDNRSYLDACLLLVAIQDSVDRHKDLMEKQKKLAILEYLLQVGLKDIAAVFAKELGTALPKVAVIKSMDVRMSVARLQMEHMGHLLARPVAAEDSRVGFCPDPWQRWLLDIIDNDESAVVCAPTSSGKTFISYYCMKKVLKQSDDGLVIFVAPNRQCAHQATADVYGHFSRKVYKNDGHTLVGEYSTVWSNVTTCQILITDPEHFQTFLTDRKLYSSMYKRLKYLIVDEVHCIDEVEDGALWERLLMLTRCPFLALSATIGNIDHFHGWLQRCQNVVQKHDQEEQGEKRRRSYKVHKVPDGEVITEVARWSDLQKYIYIPKTPEQRTRWCECRPKRSKQALGQDAFHPIHPCSCMDTDQLAAIGFPGDLGFVPRESILLYDRMRRVAELDSVPKCALDRLHPDVFFKDLPAINQTQAREYGRTLKQELQGWAQDPTRVQLCHQVLAMHGEDLKVALKKVETEGACSHHPNSKKWLGEHLVHLLTSLYVEDKMPALVFHFDETTCENLAESVVEFLEAKEAEYRATPEFKGKMQDLARRQKEAEARMKIHEKVLRNRKEEDATEEDEILDLSDLGDLREKEILPQFTFVRADEGEGLDEDTLRQTMRRVSFGYPKEHVLHRALLRGIGVHHSGLPYSYRMAVETLFRAKHIKCVISTKTMALGIHMPCRSVVFAGDHPQLNPLQFRQMSGRAGRRGFDLLGHVIFFGVPGPKIRQLMTSEIPSLKGHWPLTPALVHRLLMLHSHPELSQQLQKRVRSETHSLCEAPLMMVQVPGEDPKANEDRILRRTSRQARLYFATIVDFLAANGLVNPHGECQAFSDMAGKLFRFEPAHFVFIALLKQGLLHKMTSSYKPLQYNEKYTLSKEELEQRTRTNEQCLQSLLLLLCHVTSRRELHRSVLADKDIRSQTEHQVFLPPLSVRVQAAIDAFSQRTMACFTAHAVNAARELKEEGHKDALPLSQMTFDGVEAGETEGILAQMKASAIQFEAKSSFVAMGGHGDMFESPAELALGVRDGIYVDPEVIPMVESRGTSRINKGSLLMNAAVLDFQRSSSQVAVMKWTGLNYKELWEDLNRFCRFLVRFTHIVLILEGQQPHWDGDYHPQSTPLLKCIGDLCSAFMEAYTYPDGGRKLHTPRRPPLIRRRRR